MEKLNRLNHQLSGKWYNQDFRLAYARFCY